MAVRNSSTDWGFVSKALHWTIALLVFGMLAVGAYMVRQPPSPQLFEIYALHKATGILVLALMALRLGWRLVNPTPDLPDTLSARERVLAKGAHWAFYGIILAMPISGWIISSAANFPVSFYGLFTLPDLVGPDEDLQGLAEQVHFVLGLTLGALLLVHLAAVAKHHVVLKDRVFVRMLPKPLGRLLGDKA